MNKGEFLKSMAEKGNYTIKEATNAYDAMVTTIAEALKNGEKIQLSGFATFEVKERPARTSRNPRTGEMVNVPAAKVPTAKFGASFKNIIE